MKMFVSICCTLVWVLQTINAVESCSNSPHPADDLASVILILLLRTFPRRTVQYFLLSLSLPVTVTTCPVGRGRHCPSPSQPSLCPLTPPSPSTTSCPCSPDRCRPSHCPGTAGMSCDSHVVADKPCDNNNYVITACNVSGS